MNRVNSFYEKVLYDSLQEAHYRNIRMRKSFFNPTSESNLGFLHDTGRAAACSISQAAVLEFVNQPESAAEAYIVWSSGIIHDWICILDEHDDTINKLHLLYFLSFQFLNKRFFKMHLKSKFQCYYNDGLH